MFKDLNFNVLESRTSQPGSRTYFGWFKNWFLWFLVVRRQ